MRTHFAARVGRRVAFGLSLVLLSACAPVATPTLPTSSTPFPQATPRERSQDLSPTAIVPTPGSTPSSTPTPVVVSQEKPQYGGHLTLMLSANPPNLDPNGDPQTANINEPARASVEALLRRNAWQPTIPIQGHLAETWDITPDGTTYTFKLRKGIVWQDGSPLTVQDVAFTLDRYRNPPSNVRSGVKPYLKPIKDIQIVDDTTLRIILEQRSAFMLEILTYVAVFQKKWIEGGGDPTRNMMGTGPFKFESYTPSVNWHFVKNPNYWQPGTPYLDQLTWFILNDPATRLAAVRTGRVKVASSRFSQISVSDKERIEKDILPIQIWPTFVQGAPYLLFNMGRPPYNDVRVRRAIHLVFDRAVNRKVVFGNAGRPGFWLTYSRPPGIPLDELLSLPGFREDPGMKQQDIAEAKKLMAQAGYPDGFKAVILSRPITDNRNEAVFTANELKKIGIQATLEVPEDAAVFAKMGRGDFEMGQLTGGAANQRVDPSDATGLFFLPTSVFNYSHFDDPEFLKLFDEQNKILDPTARSTVVRKMEQRIIDVMPGLHAGYFHGFNLAWDDVKNWPRYDRSLDSDVFTHVWMAR